MLSCCAPYTQYGKRVSVTTWYICAVGWLSWRDQLRPPSKLTLAPPSLLSIMRSGSSGAIQRSWLSPWGTRIGLKVRPPSCDR